METKIYDRSKEVKGLCKKRLTAWFLTLVSAVSAVALYPCAVFAGGTQVGAADSISLAAATSISNAKTLKNRLRIGLFSIYRLRNARSAANSF